MVRGWVGRCGGSGGEDVSMGELTCELPTCFPILPRPALHWLYTGSDAHWQLDSAGLGCDHPAGQGPTQRRDQRAMGMKPKPNTEPSAFTGKEAESLLLFVRASCLFDWLFSWSVEMGGENHPSFLRPKHEAKRIKKEQRKLSSG